MSSGIIAVTGGIGCGKSVVCRILRMRGYTVVDTDSHARALMDSDDEIKCRLAAEISGDVVRGGVIDRVRLAEIVFSDEDMLNRLNAIVHGKVRASIARMAERTEGIFFVETAIFFQSGLNRMAAAEWRVESPLDIRVRRVMQRNGLSERQILDRIESQRYILAPDEPVPPLTVIVNDERSPLLPQIDEALAKEFSGLR